MEPDGREVRRRTLGARQDAQEGEQGEADGEKVLLHPTAHGGQGGFDRGMITQ